MAAPGRVLLEAACALEFACWFRCKACFRVLLLTLWSWHAGAAMQGGQGVGCLKVLLLVRFGAGLLVPLQGAAVRVVRAFGDGRGLLVLCVRFGGGVLVPLQAPLQGVAAGCRRRMLRKNLSLSLSLSLHLSIPIYLSQFRCLSTYLTD